MATPLDTKANITISAKDNASATLAKVTQTLQESAKKVEAIKAAVQLASGAFVAQAILEFGTALKDGLKAQIDYADGLNDAADRTGVAVDKLAGLNEVAKLSDVSVETLGKSLTKLSIAMNDTPEKFATLGIKIKAANGDLLGADEAFANVADAIQKIDDPAKQASTAVAIFGKAGADLLPLLKQGGDNIRSLQKDMATFGANVSDKLAKATGDFNDKLQVLDIISQGFKNSLIASLIPTINVLFETFLEYQRLTADTSKANGDLNKSVEELADGNGFKTLMNVVGAVGNVFQALWNVVEITWGSIKIILQEIVTYILFVSDAIQKVANRDFKGVGDSWDAMLKQQDDNWAAYKKTLDENLNRETFWSKMERAQAKAVDGIKAKNKEIVETCKATDIASGQAAAKTVSSIAMQLRNINAVADKAVEKAKRAADEQKKLADDFEALAKRLSQKNPGGSLGNSLDQVKRNAEAEKKINELYNKKNEDAYKSTQDKKIDDLKATYERQRQLADESGSNIDKTRADDAKKMLDLATAEKQRLEMNQEIYAINKDRVPQEASFNERTETRSVLMREIASIQQNITSNAKAGITSELEIKRLQDVGKVLEENKDKATGVFATYELQNYVKQLQDLSKQAAEQDAELAKSQASKAVQAQQEALTQLQEQLNNLPFKFMDSAVVDEADKLKEKVAETLKNAKMSVDVVANLITGDLQPVSGFKGLDTAKSAASASSSFLEPLKNTQALNIPSYTRNFEPDVVNSVTNNTSTTEKNVTIDLRTNNGTIKVDSNTSQEEIDARARAALRRS